MVMGGAQVHARMIGSQEEAGTSTISQSVTDLVTANHDHIPRQEAANGKSHAHGHQKIANLFR
jgi:hypothetical protein